MRNLSLGNKQQREGPLVDGKTGLKPGSTLLVRFNRAVDEEGTEYHPKLSGRRQAGMGDGRQTLFFLLKSSGR